MDKLKVLFSFALVRAFRFFRKIPYSQNRELLIVKVDGIGDYILFRNFIEVIKKSKKYRDHKITLVGNSLWKDLATHFDKEVVDHFIWIDRHKFSRSFSYCFKSLWSLSKKSYTVSINGAISREFLLGDLLIGSVYSKKKICAKSHINPNLSWLMDQVGGHFYNQTVRIPKSCKFEFYKNKHYIGQIIGEQISQKKPLFSLKQAGEFPHRAPYAVLSIGAGSKKRQWPISYFAQVAEYLHTVKKLRIFICGGLQDRESALEFSKHFSHVYENLVGKESLCQFVETLGGAEVLVSNESMAPHLAVALEVPQIITISNGNHLGRFIPYPNEIYKHYHPVFHPGVSLEEQSAESLQRQFEFESPLDICEIKPEQVIASLKVLFSSRTLRVSSLSQ